MWFPEKLLLEGRAYGQIRCLPPAHYWGQSWFDVHGYLPLSLGWSHFGWCWPLLVLLARCQACIARLWTPAKAGLEEVGLQKNTDVGVWFQQHPQHSAVGMSR